MNDSPSAGRVLLLDGGTGSELRRRGVDLARDAWSADANLNHPERLTEIHRDHIRAGADIVTANTFATTRFVLAAAGLGPKFRAINQAAIGAARRAIGSAADSSASSSRPVTLAASLSCLPPTFDPRAYPEADDEYRAYAELAELFAASSVDLVLLEMMQDTVHAPRACRAVRACRLPFWIGISCRRDRASGRLVAFDDPATNFDDAATTFDDVATPFEAVVDALLPFDPAGIAVMHSPLDAVAPALAVLRERWPGPLGAYAEIPYPQDPDGAREQPAISPERYAETADQWLALGAALIGGCCGTTPAHIGALRKVVDAK